jgi:hypothetical protein
LDAVGIATLGTGGEIKLARPAAKPPEAWVAAGLVGGTGWLVFRMYHTGSQGVRLAREVHAKAWRETVLPAIKEGPGLIVDAVQGIGGVQGVWNRIRSWPREVYTPRPVGLGGPLTAPAPTR